MLSEHPVYGRAHTSDFLVINAVFGSQEFSFLDDIQGFAPRFIVDLGANIGASVAYFASKFPDATIVALEPSHTNLAVASLNTHPYTNVHLLHGAIWDKETHVHIDRQRTLSGEWGFRTFDVQGGGGQNWHHTQVPLHSLIPAYTMESIVTRFKIEQIDLLKVDVECSEYRMFKDSASSKWLEKVGCMTMEVHYKCDAGNDAKYISAAAEQAGMKWLKKVGELDMWCGAQR
jgi:FkbM family methyltransferase